MLLYYIVGGSVFYSAVLKRNVSCILRAQRSIACREDGMQTLDGIGEGVSLTGNDSIFDLKYMK